MSVCLTSEAGIRTVLAILLRVPRPDVTLLLRLFQPGGDFLHRSGGLPSSGSVHRVLILPTDRTDLRPPTLWLVPALSLAAYF